VSARSVQTPDDLPSFSLRALRQARGLSREQTAEGAGVPVAKLVAYEEQGRYLPQADRHRLERFLGLMAGTLPKRHPVAAPAPLAAPPPPWARTLAEWLGQGVAVSVGDRPGTPLQGRLVAADETALVLARGGEQWLIRAERVNWVRADAGSYPPARGDAARPLWGGVLAAWAGALVRVNVGLGELLPARLLDGDNAALLLDYAGQPQLVRAGRVNWVSRKTD
jgi:transcriptional regulator with XRE-family HTH domain